MKGAIALLAFVAAVALAGADGLASVDSVDEPLEEELPRAHAGLTAALPEVDVSRFPLGDPIPAPPEAKLPASQRASARLRMLRLDGSLLLDVQPFDAHGDPIPAAFDRIARALSARSGAAVPMDPRLVELLITISNAFGGKPLSLVSGHREAGLGTRKTSYHVKGMAVDIAIRGEKVHDVRNAAKRLGARGIGVYPSFVHVDARRDQPYYWVGGSYHRWRAVRTAPRGRVGRPRR